MNLDSKIHIVLRTIILLGGLVFAISWANHNVYVSPKTLCRICACQHLLGECVTTCRAHVCVVDCETRCHHNGFCSKEKQKP